MKEFEAPWGKALWIISVSATAILLAVAVLPVPGLWWVRMLPLAILTGAVPFVVRGYAILDDALLIHRLLWDTRIELSGLRSARIDPSVISGSIRTCGNGGLFSFTGWYWNRRLGKYRMYVTDLKQPVVLTFDTRCMVVSPSDPEAFVRELSVFCGRGQSKDASCFCGGTKCG